MDKPDNRSQYISSTTTADFRGDRRIYTPTALNNGFLQFHRNIAVPPSLSTITRPGLGVLNAQTGWFGQVPPPIYNATPQNLTVNQQSQPYPPRTNYYHLHLSTSYPASTIDHQFYRHGLHDPRFTGNHIANSQYHCHEGTHKNQCNVPPMHEVRQPTQFGYQSAMPTRVKDQSQCDARHDTANFYRTALYPKDVKNGIVDLHPDSKGRFQLPSQSITVIDTIFNDGTFVGKQKTGAPQVQEGARIESSSEGPSSPRDLTKSSPLLKEKRQSSEDCQVAAAFNQQQSKRPNFPKEVTEILTCYFYFAEMYCTRRFPNAEDKEIIFKILGNRINDAQLKMWLGNARRPERKARVLESGQRYLNAGILHWNPKLSELLDALKLMPVNPSPFLSSSPSSPTSSSAVTARSTENPAVATVSSTTGLSMSSTCLPPHSQSKSDGSENMSRHEYLAVKPLLTLQLHPVNGSCRAVVPPYSSYHAPRRYPPHRFAANPYHDHYALQEAVPANVTHPYSHVPHLSNHARYMNAHPYPSSSSPSTLAPGADFQPRQLHPTFPRPAYRYSE